jgi:addiction module HigA family antidote
MKTTFHIPLGPAANTPGDILREEFLLPLGLSIRDLSRKMGCGPMTVSEIVRGKRSVTARTSILLGRALGVSPSFFSAFRWIMTWLARRLPWVRPRLKPAFSFW